MAALPQIQIEIITRSSKGDELTDVPLHTVEGSDFFTQDIFDALKNGEADIAVHSLKDMSSEHFFGKNHFAVVDRGDIRDIAIFNEGIEEKIKKGETIIIGTCSPRREEMAMGFLKKALPQLNSEIKIETRPIRGNVETRLKKLESDFYDGTILATAGLNRLLKGSETSSNHPVLENRDGGDVKTLLKNKKIMLLPLIECVPAPCQGAIGAEAHQDNQKAIAVLDAINNSQLYTDCAAEKRTAAKYGKGCLQQFGIASIYYGHQKTTYAAGKDEHGNDFQQWYDLPVLDIEGKTFFSSTDRMGDFFDYEFLKVSEEINQRVVYIGNFKSVRGETLTSNIKKKKVWVAGTRTWYELAKKGVWVEGCADALGLETLPALWETPLFQIDKDDVILITNEQAANGWQQKRWKTMATYRLVERKDKKMSEQIKEADFIFWTSASQYDQFKDLVRKEAVHACPYGETTERLKAAGVEPVVFPTIKSFKQWRKFSIRPLSAG